MLIIQDVANKVVGLVSVPCNLGEVIVEVALERLKHRKGRTTRVLKSALLPVACPKTQIQLSISKVQYEDELSPSRGVSGIRQRLTTEKLSMNEY